ncbi:MAG: type 2 isopentenyl-diphosphate Delta-isomerase [Chloroflexota bacterium]|nr:MAG: type 2 isopentenyl-diphosphate Delta-isomerase [Chloroflexota bacterium]
MPDETIVSNRKVEHLRINLEENVQFFDVSTGLEKYRFVHQALPELDLDAIDTSLELFGKKLRAPLLVSSMTGGASEAERINRNLAAAAQATRIAMGLGSQRAAIADPALARTYQVRDLAPDILLFANLGAIQLNYGYTLDECRRAIEMIDADALFLHLNPIQEAVQAHGNTNWSGLLKKIETVCHTLDVPVIVKEVGFGISENTARQLVNAGVRAIDVAGAGGTSWAAVEAKRAPNAELQKLAETFWDWGIPTAETLVQVRKAAPGLPIFASGGIRDGIQVAKCVALGASLVGLASPMLKLAHISSEAAIEGIHALVTQLRVAMFGVAAQNLSTLRDSPFLRKIN